MRVLLLSTFLLLPPVATAQSAADQYYDPIAMAAARSALKSSHGSGNHSFFIAERLELASNDGDTFTLLQGQGWIGGDINKLWLKAEAEWAAEESVFEELELQALFSRAISPFWDLQLGLRHDFDPEPSRDYAVIGIRGDAPYWIEVDAALFVSDQGDASARLEAEYDIRLTQRLLLQPRVEVDAAFATDREIGVGSGLSSIEAGLRLRYEASRRIAPYVGVHWTDTFGDTSRLRKSEGDDADSLSLVAGLRFWF